MTICDGIRGETRRNGLRFEDRECKCLPKGWIHNRTVSEIILRVGTGHSKCVKFRAVVGEEIFQRWQRVLEARH
jgi:hypothetical protein